MSASRFVFTGHYQLNFENRPISQGSWKSYEALRKLMIPTSWLARATLKYPTRATQRSSHPMRTVGQPSTTFKPNIYMVADICPIARALDRVFSGHQSRRICGTDTMKLKNLDCRLLRLPEVLTLNPVSKATFSKGMGSNTYPKPVKISSRLSVWKLADIRDCVQRMVDEHRAEV